jgi:hypothetical protein
MTQRTVIETVEEIYRNDVGFAKYVNGRRKGSIEIKGPSGTLQFGSLQDLHAFCDAVEEFYEAIDEKEAELNEPPTRD